MSFLLKTGKAEFLNDPHLSSEVTTTSASFAVAKWQFSQSLPEKKKQSRRINLPLNTWSISHITSYNFYQLSLKSSSISADSIYRILAWVSTFLRPWVDGAEPKLQRETDDTKLFFHHTFGVSALSAVFYHAEIPCSHCITLHIYAHLCTFHHLRGRWTSTSTWSNWPSQNCFMWILVMMHPRNVTSSPIYKSIWIS